MPRRFHIGRCGVRSNTSMVPVRPLPTLLSSSHETKRDARGQTPMSTQLGAMHEFSKIGLDCFRPSSDMLDRALASRSSGLQSPTMALRSSYTSVDLNLIQRINKASMFNCIPQPPDKTITTLASPGRRITICSRVARSSFHSKQRSNLKHI